MNDTPFPLNNLLASMAEALKVRGDSRAIAAIAEGACRLEQGDSDWGVTSWTLYVELPVHVFYALSESEVEAVESAILSVATPFFAVTPFHGIDGVTLAPQVALAGDKWRDDALKFIKGEGVTNQGRVRSDNIASKQHRGLLFRSKPEIVLFEAMTRARLAVSPLPVFVRIGKQYNRLEPDFIVVYKGLTFVVEVDGDSFHKELPADADKRLVPLTCEGVEVRRIRAAELQSDASADGVVHELIQFMESRKQAR